jgi:hypothetical protein
MPSIQQMELPELQKLFFEATRDFLKAIEENKQWEELSELRIRVKALSLLIEEKMKTGHH